MRVTDYKCVLDSEWFSVGELTCLVGKNESGKTALLEALEKLNSVQPNRANFNPTDTYPRMDLTTYKRSGVTAIPIETQWELSSAEIEAINDLVGTPVLLATTVGLSKSYKNELLWTVNIDYAAAAKHYLDESSLTSGERQPLRDTSPGDLLKSLAGIAQRTPRQEALRTRLAERLPSGSLRRTVESCLLSYLPKFLYYTHYDKLPGQVSLEKLMADRAANRRDHDPGDKVFIALLSMVDTTPEAIGRIQRFEPLVAELEAVGNSLSSRIFEYWTQDRHLEVEFRFDQAKSEDPSPYNAGNVFRTRIRNNRHGVTIGLDERSAGFIWFFSFLVWFSEVTRTHGENLVVLLDEPGLSLHARAQADLLRFIKEVLLAKYQVIYTTHSPFMIDASDLLSCRTVEDATGPVPEEVLGTKVGDDVLSTDADTLFPLQAALGYDITQRMLVDEHCLLVEGTSELVFLQWFSKELRSRRRTGLDPRWTITPCGGITKVASFVALFGGRPLLHVGVLTDYGPGDKANVKRLRDAQLLQESNILTAAMFVQDSDEADIEDMVGRDLYVALVNGAYQLAGRKAVPEACPEGAPPRVVEEVTAHFKLLTAAELEYDYLRPAEYLMAIGAAADLPGLDGALDRFEALFQAANGLLRSR